MQWVRGVKIRKRQSEGGQEDPGCTSTYLQRGAILMPAEDGVSGRTRVADGCMKRSRVESWPKGQCCCTAGKTWTGWWWLKDTKENCAGRVALGEGLMRLELFNLKQTSGRMKTVFKHPKASADIKVKRCSPCLLRRADARGCSEGGSF